MQRCPNCQSQQLDGTIFCAECGASLFSAPQHHSTSLIEPKKIAQPKPTHAPEAAPTVAPAEIRLTIHILSSNRQIRLPHQQEFLIGRRDDARGIHPDIDLNEDGGYDAGVSRRHALIIWKDDHYEVEDLSSANGTFVNDRRVAGQARHPLRNGDELRCGMLGIRIEISP